MISQRGTHYTLWLALFGIVLGLVKGFNSSEIGLEATVLTITGLIGLITGMGSNFSRIARFYDLAVGLIFSALGLLGVLTAFPLGHQIGLSTSSMVLGLDMAVPYALIHLVLGLTSLNHGFKSVPVPPVVEVGTARTGATA